eukprot:m.119205 g.119205  ORF g.119205 m.119205 type:complete len:326 (-) comp21783_c0_seq1:221-1198(-)
MQPRLRLYPAWRHDDCTVVHRKRSSIVHDRPHPLKLTQSRFQQKSQTMVARVARVVDSTPTLPYVIIVLWAANAAAGGGLDRHLRHTTIDINTSLTSVHTELGQYPFVGAWRGEHGHAVGLCTAELVAKEWVITAGHCATRELRGEVDHVRVTFQHAEHIERGVTHCVHADVKVDLALCHLKLPVNAFQPAALNADLYRSDGIHGAPVMCVGTYHGLHSTGPKILEYESNGAHLYVNNAGGSGMHAGDSGGAWVHQVQGGGNGSAPGNRSEWVLSGVIHGGEGDGAHRRGVAMQMSFVRTWINKITNKTGEGARWVHVRNASIAL